MRIVMAYAINVFVNMNSKYLYYIKMSHLIYFSGL
jgi:hypothetical protein